MNKWISLTNPATAGRCCKRESTRCHITGSVSFSLTGAAAGAPPTVSALAVLSSPPACLSVASGAVTLIGGRANVPILLTVTCSQTSCNQCPCNPCRASCTVCATPSTGGDVAFADATSCAQSTITVLAPVPPTGVVTLHAVGIGAQCRGS
jgi:hypothetical protein